MKTKERIATAIVMFEVFGQFWLQKKRKESTICVVVTVCNPFWLRSVWDNVLSSLLCPLELKYKHAK